MIGGIAVIAHGVPRVTRDIDIAFSGADITLQRVVADLERSTRMADALAFATETQVLLLRHTDTQVNIDASLAWLPFELEAIAAADSVSIAGSTVLRVARPEDLVIYKAIAWRPQDQQDVERLSRSPARA